VLLLGIDTATAATTVALSDGVRVLAESTTTDPRRHAEVLGPAIDEVLHVAGARAADLTAVGVGVGPGPYTGLRVGVATATALADALHVPAYGICSLDVLAHQAGPDETTVVTDARRREVFWAQYAGGVRVEGPAVNRPADVPIAGRVVGPGALLYADFFEAVHPPHELSAAALCELVCVRLRSDAALAAPRPIYLRRPDTAPPSAVAKAVLQR
jgi:tRNA threonylcarbamoyl adenosine modification protein YeaZ